LRFSFTNLFSFALRHRQPLDDRSAAGRNFYVIKKPAVEEAFKISLGANTQHLASSQELVR
jgi:hypothetical protein